MTTRTQLPSRSGEAPHVVIDDASFYGPGATDLVYRDAHHCLHSPEGCDSGTNQGQLLIELAIDDEDVDIVYADLGPTQDLAAIERAIEVLGRLYSGLSSLYEGAQVPPKAVSA